MLIEELTDGSLAITLCGVPVIHRLADKSSLQVYTETGKPTVIDGTGLGRERSQSLFRREPRIRKLIVDIPENALR